MHSGRFSGLCNPHDRTGRNFSNVGNGSPECSDYSGNCPGGRRWSTNSSPASGIARSASTHNQARNQPTDANPQPSGKGAGTYPKSTPIPGGEITFPAGALLGSLPIVDSTPGFRIIQSWSAHPDSERTTTPSATARLINLDLLPVRL